MAGGRTALPAIVFLTFMDTWVILTMSWRLIKFSGMSFYRPPEPLRASRLGISGAYIVLFEISYVIQVV